MFKRIFYILPALLILVSCNRYSASLRTSHLQAWSQLNKTTSATAPEKIKPGTHIDHCIPEILAGQQIAIKKEQSNNKFPPSHFAKTNTTHTVKTTALNTVPKKVIDFRPGSTSHQSKINPGLIVIVAVVLALILLPLIPAAILALITGWNLIALFLTALTINIGLSGIKIPLTGNKLIHKVNPAIKVLSFIVGLALIGLGFYISWVMLGMLLPAIILFGFYLIITLLPLLFKKKIKNLAPPPPVEKY